MIRIKDIADRAGVSPTTVSNVIHGKTGRVSKATVEKINRILKEMEYVPSISARMLANNSSGLIGVGNARKPGISDPGTRLLYDAGCAP